MNYTLPIATIKPFERYNYRENDKDRSHLYANVITS